MTTHATEFLLEDAVGVVLRTYGEGLSSLHYAYGGSEENMQLPAIVIASTNTEADLADGVTGNITIEMEISLYTSYDNTTRAEHLSLESALYDILYRKDLRTLLNNANFLSTVETIEPLSCDRDLDSGIRMTTRRILLYVQCRGGD